MGTYMLQSMKRTIRNSEKIYPTKRRLIVFKQPFDVAVGEQKKKEKKKKTHSPFIQGMLQEKSLQRTKTTIRDIILCNNFELFCTFTFKDHRDEVDVCKARMQYWLQSQQKKYGSFEYVIVPEFHADGKALHFHALFQGFKGKIVQAQNPQGEDLVSRSGRNIFNIKGWRNGFAECTYIDDGPNDQAKVASYVTKYITKDMPVFRGKKRYWVSQGIARPITATNVDELPYLADDTLQRFEKEFFTIYVVEKIQTVADPQ